MSFLHSLYAYIIRQSKHTYDPQRPPDYQARRIAEERQGKANSRLPRRILATPIHLNGVRGELLQGAGSADNLLFLYLHGGGFVGGSYATKRMFTGFLADMFHCPVAAIDYRLAPEFPYPAAVDDCFAAYQALCSRYAQVVLVGESAGGNLVLATALRAMDANLKLPAAVIALSPATQFSADLASYRRNAKTDCMVNENLNLEVRNTYLRGVDLKNSAYAEPLYRELSGFPPTFISVSGSEVLLDDSILFYQKLRDSGVSCKLDVMPRLMHAFAIFPQFPESRQVWNEIRDWLYSSIKADSRPL